MEDPPSLWRNGGGSCRERAREEFDSEIRANVGFEAPGYRMEYYGIRKERKARATKKTAGLLDLAMNSHLAVIRREVIWDCWARFL